MALFGLLFAIAIPNFVRGGPSKFNGILNRLRQIDTAKYQWAIEHGLTNAPLPSRAITEKDLAPYLLPAFTQKEFGNPECGEIYLIRDLNQPTETILTRDFAEKRSAYSYPRGTIIRLDAQPESDGWEIISPDGTSTIYRWMHGNLTVINR
jgi:hypothetical protein